MKKEKLLADLAALPDISADLADEMATLYLERGGLLCCIRWPEQFSFFAGFRNALDVIQENEG